MSINKQRVYLFGAILLLSAAFFFFMERHRKAEEADIDKNKIETVGYIDQFKSSRGYDNYYFTFFHNGIKYHGYQTVDGGSRARAVGRHFLVQFSSRNPEHNRLLLDFEITDSIQMENAGFTYY